MAYYASNIPKGAVCALFKLQTDCQRSHSSTGTSPPGVRTGRPLYQVASGFQRGNPRFFGPDRIRTPDPLVAKHSGDSGEKSPDASDGATPRTDETLRQEAVEAPCTDESQNAPKSTANVTLMAPDLAADLVRIAEAWPNLPDVARRSILDLVASMAAQNRAPDAQEGR